jgi:four helix bundle protein
LSIALKEANETEYWMLLLKDSGFIDEKVFTSIHADCIELIKLLTSIINTSKKTINN